MAQWQSEESRIAVNQIGLFLCEHCSGEEFARGGALPGPSRAMLCFVIGPDLEPIASEAVNAKGLKVGVDFIHDFARGAGEAKHDTAMAHAFGIERKVRVASEKLQNVGGGVRPDAWELLQKLEEIVVGGGGVKSRSQVKGVYTCFLGGFERWFL